MKTVDVYVGQALVWILILFLLGIAVWWAWDEIHTLIKTFEALT